MEAKVAKRKRSANFTAREVETLVTEVEKRKEVLFGKLSGNVTGDLKNKAWAEVTASVNEVGIGQVRKECEVKKKWSDTMSALKRRESKRHTEMKATGGGSLESDVPLTETDHKILGILGSESIVGVNGGLDVGVQDLQAKVPPSPQASTSTQVFVQNSPNPQASTSTQFFVQHEERKRKRVVVGKDGLCECGGGLQRLIDLDERRLEVEEERLKVEKERLELEKERFEWERKRYEMKLLGLCGMTLIAGYSMFITVN